MSGEAEHLEVEGQLGVEGGADVGGLAEPVLLAGERVVGDGGCPWRAAASTIISDCAGGTTSSSSPWNTTSGRSIASTWLIGERAA